MRSRDLAWCVALLACQRQEPAATAVFTTIEGSTGLSSGSSSTGAASTSSSSTTSAATTTSASGETLSSTSAATLVHDVGWESSSGDTKPIGCQGKIDFLFVMEANPVLDDLQEKLVAAFPEFIETIETKFADFDYHIMVVEADTVWGLTACTDACPVEGCKVGEPCCPFSNPKGAPCCPIGYPCDEVDNLTACDTTIGAGTVTPAGGDASNERCKIANGRRYMTKGQPNLTGTFACVAQVGTSGSDRVGDAVVGAVSSELNGPEGCNEGFLRDDALLVITVVATAVEGSQDYPYPWDWHDKVVEAKHGDPDSVITLLIGNNNCPIPGNYPCQFVKSFKHHWVEGWDAPSYGPAFEKATDLVATACEDFIPQ